MKEVRWKIACINWGHPTAPKAMVYMLTGGEMIYNRCFVTHAQAIDWVTGQAWRTT